MRLNSTTRSLWHLQKLLPKQPFAITIATHGRLGNMHCSELRACCALTTCLKLTHTLSKCLNVSYQTLRWSCLPSIRYNRASHLLVQTFSVGWPHTLYANVPPRQCAICLETPRYFTCYCSVIKLSCVIVFVAGCSIIHRPPPPADVYALQAAHPVGRREEGASQMVIQCVPLPAMRSQLLITGHYYWCSFIVYS